MLTIMKYETIRQRLSKFIMLGLLAVLEVVFLIGLYGQMDKPMGYAIVGLTFLAIFSFMYVSVESILNYNQDLSKKSGYMLFMTPHSVYEILGAKIIHNILTIILTALVFGLVAFLDIMLILLKYDSIQYFLDQIQQILNEFANLNISTASIVSTVVLMVILWISTVAIAFLAITLTYTFLHAVPAKGLISFGIFLALNFAYSWVSNHLLDALPNAYMPRTLGAAALTAVVAALCLWLDGWMLTRKLAL